VSTLRARPGTYAGLFLITLSTLMYEIALTRIFSVTMWYHFAFVAISLALFGLTVGALLVYFLPGWFRDRDVRSRLWLFSLLFGVSLAVCFVTQLTIPFTPEANVAGAWSVAFTCIVIAIPFTLSGVVVCLALTRFPAQVNRLYATDLTGAALGCVLLVLLFFVLDGPSLVIAIGAIAAVGAFLFARDAGSRRGMTWAIVGVVALGGFAALNGAAHAKGHPLLRIIWAKEEADPAHQYEKWNAYSRVTVDEISAEPTGPSGVGFSPLLPDDAKARELLLVIDSNASSVLTGYDGDPATTDFLRFDVSNLAHHIRRNADVAVIGVGGGRDILSALEFDQRSVTGIEINENILEATNEDFGDFTGHLDRDPRVRFVNDEARSYLTRTDREFDLIQISLIDTWAASSAGAYALSENSLYTTEAWNTFFDRLRPGGILSVSRWYDVPGRDKPLEAYRATALAAQVLKERGVADPRDHLLLYKAARNQAGASAVTLLASEEPFAETDLATLERETTRLEFIPVLTPTEAPDERFAALAAPDGPGAAVDDFDEDVSPPTDNRPFFFQMASLGTLLSGAGFSGDDSTRPVLVLGLLAATVLGLALGFIVLPLLLKTERGAHRGMAPFYTYFAGIGLGFLLVEISQLQRLTVFLGHPTYALTVVLFSLLVFSGLGSFASARLADPNRPRLTLVPLGALLVVVAAIGLLTPTIIEAADGSTTPVRIATAVAILAPLGLVMGMPFAIGMRAAATRPGAPTAFLWGINGATSVCASVLAVAIAVFYGISSSYWTGFVAYAMAAASLVVIARRTRVRVAEPVEHEVEVPERVAAPV
jgi:SAM-dependent methyltransferase